MNLSDRPLREIILVFILGFVVRIYAGVFSHIVNPDGVLYIYQAQLIYSGRWNDLTSCGLSFLSAYPPLIALFIPIFGDAVLAARAVSVLFGTLFTIPMYFLLTRLFDYRTGMIQTLILLLTPVFVGRSADVVREPFCWFFIALGLLFFVMNGEDEKRRGFMLVFSCISFLIAAWARIEAIIFIPVTVFFLVFFSGRNGPYKAFLFLIPIFVTAATMTTLSLAADISPPVLRGGEILAKFTAPIDQYGALRCRLQELADQVPDPLTAFFLPEARNCIWLIALGTILNRTLEAFFYPFIVFFMAGFVGFSSTVKREKRFLYVFFLILSGFLLLYVHVVQTWMMYYRFLGIVIIPGALISALGIQRISSYIEKRSRLTKQGVAVLMTAFVIVFGLPKNMLYRDADKAVFRRIGEHIAVMEQERLPAAVVTSRHTQRWILFYANRRSPFPFCPQQHELNWENYPSDYDGFMDYVQDNEARYFLWEQKHWPAGRFNVHSAAFQKDFIEVGEYHHPDTGKMILYQLKKTAKG